MDRPWDGVKYINFYFPKAEPKYGNFQIVKYKSVCQMQFQNVNLFCDTHDLIMSETISQSGISGKEDHRKRLKWYVHYYYYYYYNAFITRHTSGLKTCSEALTNIQYRIV